MDFFDRQEKAHRNTKLLVVYFIAGVSMLIVAIYLVALVLFTAAGSRHQRSHPYEVQPQRAPLTLWNPGLFWGVTAGTLAVVGIGSVFKTIELSQGGSAVATMLGGRLVNANTSDPDERKLMNVIEEMALASGIPVPQVYVLDQERGINACAAGHSTSDAAVTVTRGCMKLLTRDELQGVIGHEFSHILNGDMRLNLRLMGIIFGIICLAVIGRVLLYTRGSGRDRNALPLFGLALLVIGWIGVFFGHLIQAAVSRQREFLADASSVQFTRNPAGITGALKKIGGLSYGSKLESAHAGEASHMFFGNGVSQPLFGLMATHPPLEARIRAIDPAFDGVFPPVAMPDMEEPTADAPAAKRRLPPPFPFPLPGMPQARGNLAGLMSAAVAAEAVLPSLGTPGTGHLQYAAGLRDSLPPELQNAARDALGASALVYALLISTEPKLREQQLQMLAEKASDAIRRETERLLPAVGPVAARAKLPLADLALPGLRQLSPAQYEQFSAAVQQLIESDGEIDLFEYMLQKIVLRHLDPQFKSARKPVVQYYVLHPLLRDCSVLLSALAHVGTVDPAQAGAAFAQGARVLGDAARTGLNIMAAEQCGLLQVDTALDHLNEAVPQIKKSVIQACARTVAADGVIQESEAELLRAIAVMLDCPIPPFIGPQ